MMQGDTLKTARRINLTFPIINKTLRYPTSNGMSLFIIAYPTNLTNFTPTNLTFNYTLSSFFFPVEGNNWLEAALAKG